MCLDTVVTKRQFFKKFGINSINHHPKYPHLLIGFKVVKPTGLGFRPTNFGSRAKVFSIGNWMHEKEMRPDFYSSEKTLYCGASIGGKSKKYRIGFHVLTNLSAAISYAKHFGLHGRHGKILKVYFTDICAYGTQDQCPIIITKEILIPKQIPYGASGRKCKKRITV
jgi:hypothetical protein